MPKTNREKMDKGIVIALIGLAGTLIAALLTSPILGKLFERTPTPGATTISNRDLQLVFENDFENGQISGFSISNEQWQVTKDKGNQVLELKGDGSENGIAIFGPNNFSDGTIEFQLYFRNFDGFILNFRSSVDFQTYTLYLAPFDGEITLGYASGASDWNLDPFEGDSIRPFQFNEGNWYDVKLEISGEQVMVWVDGNKTLSNNDSRLQRGSMEFSVQKEGTVWLDNVKVWEYR